MHQPSDPAPLLAAVATGDLAALRRLYEQWSARLYGVANAVLQDRDAAAAALVETFLRLGRRAGDYHPARAGAGPWLAGLARFAALDLAHARGLPAPGEAADPATAAPELPPPGLWPRIEAVLAPPAPGTPSGRSAADATTHALFVGLLQVGRKAALIACAVVGLALVAMLVLRRPPPEERLLSVLLTAPDQPAWLVQADQAGLRLASLNGRPAPPDRILQVWARPDGAAPTPLGLLPAVGRVILPAGELRLAPGMLIEITLEPAGGSPTGRPTGPVQFIGRLSATAGT